MRRKLALLLVASMSVVLVVSAVFVSGLVDVSSFILMDSPILLQGSESLASVSVDPGTIIKDYQNDPGFQIGDKFSIHVNVSVPSGQDLFAWQLNVTWNPAILNVSRVIPDEFLARSSEPTSSEEMEGIVMNSTDYALGYCSFAESILGDVVGIAGPTAGALVAVEFEIVGYGCSEIGIGGSGSLPTLLLNSTSGAAPIEFEPVFGYFKNKLTGDANSDGNVNSLDIGKLNAHWSPAAGTPEWSLGYSRDVDPNDDSYINSLDIGAVNANWGRTIY